MEGVYVLWDGSGFYIGETGDLEKRWSSTEERIVSYSCLFLLKAELSQGVRKSTEL